MLLCLGQDNIAPGIYLWVTASLQPRARPEALACPQIRRRACQRAMPAFGKYEKQGACRSPSTGASGFATSPGLTGGRLASPFPEAMFAPQGPRHQCGKGCCTFPPPQGKGGMGGGAEERCGQCLPGALVLLPAGEDVEGPQLGGQECRGWADSAYPAQIKEIIQYTCSGQAPAARCVICYADE
jgi:hypothetical protein